MARHNAGSGGSEPITKLEDGVHYTGKVVGFKLGPEQTFDDGNSSTPLIVELQLGPDENDILTKWFNIKFGEQKNGNVAEFRRFLNAYAGKPEREAIDWFDDETGEIQYRNGDVVELRRGGYVKFVGVNEQSRKDNSRQIFRVMKWISARKPEAAVAPSAKPETPPVFPASLPERASQPTDDSEVPW